jgi:hypothetical protein
MTDDRSRSKVLAWLAISAVICSVTSTVLMHLLVPEVDPVSELLTAYLDSQYQWLSRVGIFLQGLAMGALGLGLYFRRIAGVWFKIALAFAAITAIGSFVVAVAPEADFARVGRPAGLLTIVILSLRLRRERPWQAVGPYLPAIVIGVAALFIFIFGLTSLSAGVAGLGHRAALLLISTWILLVSHGLLAAPVQEEAGAT